MPESPIPLWPGVHQLPQPDAPFPVRWSERAREALDPSPFPPPELLWLKGGEHAHPLVVPAWARDKIPGMAEALDAGYELRRAAGLEDYR